MFAGAGTRPGRRSERAEKGFRFYGNWRAFLRALGLREMLSANRTYFVRTDGSDSNDGLSNTPTGAFLTIQKALNVAASLDCLTYNVTILVAAGTYTGAVVLPRLLGSGTFTLQGDTGTPSNVVISTTSAAAISASNAGTWSVKGFKLQTTTSGAAIATNDATVLYLYEMEYGTIAGPHQIYAGSGSRISIVANYTISGNSAYAHMTAAFNGYIVMYSRTITASGSRAFTIFAYSPGGTIDSGSCIFTGTFTGVRYQAELLGLIYTSGGGANYFPGNSAGAEATGGKYA